MSKEFQLMIDEKIEKIAARIKEVYHLERNEAIRLIKTTKFYKALTDEESKIADRDPEELFSIYKEEIETGHLIF